MFQEIEILYHLNKNRSQSFSSKAIKLVSPDVQRSVTYFHQSLPGYQPTPLATLTQLAKYLGISDLWVKSEASRFDLKAFKVLGASYAIGKLLAKDLRLDVNKFTFEQIVSQASKFRNLTFVTATDGNHGRAVAWTANRLGCKAVIYMPKGSSKFRLEAIINLGAEASIISGNYDDAVRLAAKQSTEKGWILLQDTSWPGNEEIPINIMQGYITLLTEAFQQLEGKWPSHIFMQAGVGSLAAALQAFLCHCHDKPRPFFTVVEPTEAACFYKSMNIADGKPHAVHGDLDTIMAGLACGEPSEIAWEILKENADAFIACSDQVAIKGMRILGNPLEGDDRVISGESGAVTTGLIYELLNNPMFNELAEQLGLGADSRVLVISTEGDTDPEYYRGVVW
ncbi:MAG: diaminopropionate ammonia-lyase [Deltaproteobacteria bacterium]|nr:diaminopropionate ammonia-lyase [Deltaproteobacteria bacterium]